MIKELLKLNIKGVVNYAWTSYKVDKNGALNKKQTMQFVIDVLLKLGNDEKEINKLTFDKVYASADKDNSNTIDRNEMVELIRKYIQNEEQSRPNSP